MSLSKYRYMSSTTSDGSSWSGNNDCDISIFVSVDDANMKSLVHVNKYCSEVCSTENFYRRRIIAHFGVDIRIGLRPVTDDDLKKGDSYRKAYRGISPTYNTGERWDVLEPEDYEWYTFGECCCLGYIPIVLHMLEPKQITLTRDMDLYFDDVVKAKQWDVLDILLEHGLVMDDISWDLMYHMSVDGDIEGYKRWIPKGLDVSSNSQALRSATRYGHNDLVLFLLRQGAMVNIEKGGIEDWPPLVYAVKHCTVDTVREFIKYGADIHFNDDMIFTENVWHNTFLLDDTIPDPSMLAYLTLLQKLTPQ